MTAFIFVCAALVAAALLWLLIPFFRAKSTAAATESRKDRPIAAGVLVVLLPALAALMYSSTSNWDWQGVQGEVARDQQMTDLLAQLQARLQSNPDDLNGWLLLGRSYASMEQFPAAAGAYQRAYDLSKGENVDAVLGLGEALAMSDQAALTGRASELFEEALSKAPNHPKALWYASMAALQAGELRKGRDRLQLLMALNPPEELRGVLERQIQDLNAQLGETTSAAGGEGAVAPPSTVAQQEKRSIRVAVTLAPSIKSQLQGPVALFVLARDSAGGPPLAVQRHSSEQLPLTVELSERDAMMPTRSIASVPRVQVVARLSKSGTPQAQSGDYYGQADYEFGKDTGTLNVVIDQTVP